MELILPGTIFSRIAWYLDFFILGLLILEVVSEVRSSRSMKSYVMQNAPSFTFIVIFVLLFIYTKSLDITAAGTRFEGISRGVIILRNVFIILKVFSRIKKVSAFFESITMQPAQTILLSFLLVIFSGSLILMLPFTTVAEGGLHFLDALFTSTSAVCVTGLIVVDTATYFTIWGQIVILALIQVGGLSIMVISFFTLFSIHQKVSFQDKLMLSYALNENNISLLKRRLRVIILSTFIIEAIGSLILLYPFYQVSSDWQQALLLSVFHSVSAFCNAGFSLFTTSLEGFLGNPLVNLTIALLIIAGGISFGVLSDFFRIARLRIKSLIRTVSGAREVVSLNTYVVVIITPVLIVAGIFLIYGLEHANSLAELRTGQQYLAAFFQSVTLRTAGFNTIPIGSLTTTTLLVMMPFMFIGAASGSTAGGIKINNLAVMYGYLKSILVNRDTVILRRSSLSRTQINKAFLVFFFGIFSITSGTIILSATEHGELVEIMFEVVSAFGTVGLSTGITSSLTYLGKTVIIVLMFIGRLGPLTILAAASHPEQSVQISYPRGNVQL